MRDWTDYVIWVVLLSALAIVVIVFVIEGTRDTVSLPLDEWQCERFEKVTRLLPVGKVLMPMTQDECVQWVRP